MDKISDFFSDIKERLASPLFSSFIVAWLFWNWRVPIALFFDKIQYLNNLGFRTYTDYVSKNVDNLHGIIYPTISAVIYTFGYPLLRNYILISNSWYKTWGNKKISKVTNSAVINVGRYIELKEKYQGAMEKLSKVYSEETSFLNEKDNLNNENLRLTNEKNEALRELMGLKAEFDIKILQPNIKLLEGIWELEFIERGIKSYENYEIKKGSVYSYKITNNELSQTIKTNVVLEKFKSQAVPENKIFDLKYISYWKEDNVLTFFFFKLQEEGYLTFIMRKKSEHTLMGSDQNLRAVTMKKLYIS